MNPASQQGAYRERLLHEAGGYAPQLSRPWLPGPTGFMARAAAHPSSLLLACVAGVLLAAAITVLCSAAGVLLRAPVALEARPESSSVTSGVRAMSFMSDVMSAKISVAAGERLREQGQPMRVLEPEEIAARAAAERCRLDAYNLSEAEKLAILNMGSNIRSQVLWHALRRQYSVPPFTLSTFIALRERGLAFKSPERRFHVLTAAGRAIESLVADEIQQARGIHECHLGQRGQATIRLTCTCGWSSSVRSWGDVQMKAARAMSRHLQHVASTTQLETALAPHHLGVGNGA